MPLVLVLTMFGISLPELIVILAIALIVVGPDKLPGLARSLAKGVMEMKKTLNQVKESLTEENETIRTIQHDLHTAADGLRTKFIESDYAEQGPTSSPATQDSKEEIIDMEPEARAIEAELRDPYESAAEEIEVIEAPAADRQEEQPQPDPPAAATSGESSGAGPQAA